MSQSGQKKSLRHRQISKDVDDIRNEIMMKIAEEEETFGDFTISKSVQRNVVLVGRTRVGKSTVKTMLINPMTVAEEQKLVSGTKDPVFETLHITRKKTSHRSDSSDEESPEYNVSKENSGPTNECEDLVLNIIDTPGLFERGTDEIGVRDNEIIMRAIDTCINAEITKFHVICFVVALSTGINQEDIQALKLLLETIGNQVASNACLLITHCESKDKQERKALREQLMADKDFKPLVPYFKKGIFFTGVLKREDFRSASETLIQQYFEVTDYRVKLIKMFSESVKPFPLIDTLISESTRANKSKEALCAELEQTKKKIGQIEEDFSESQSNFRSKTEQLQKTQEKLQGIEIKLVQLESELKQKDIDLVEKTDKIEQMKSSEVSLRKVIKELEDKYALNERERETLKGNLDLEEQQRQAAEAARHQEMEARREAEKQRFAELEQRCLEQTEAHERYYKEVKAKEEEARQRKRAEREKEQAEQLLKQAQDKPSCSIS